VIFVGDIVWSGWVFRSNLKRGLWIEGVREWPGEMDLRSGVVAVLDLAGDCLDCSQVIIHLRNELGETLSLLRSLMPLGFQLIHPNTYPLATGTLIGMTM